MCPKPNRNRSGYYCLSFFLLLQSTVFAQLNADFTVDKTGGCSPLVVAFTNRTTGASAAAVYTWDFGNGNTSALADPGAIYTNEQLYTVTLTVQDGSNTSVKTQQITVYKKPVVDFASSTIKGCLPLPVTFTSNSSAGSGSISGYFWDYGDGSTEMGYSSSQSHTYTAQQKASISLTVTNSYGCHTTLQKQNVVTIIPELTAAFTSDKKVLCLVSDPVQFSNSSAGPGTLDYLWDFGDGKTSTLKDPNYVFNKKGTYTVSLKVHSSEGCTVVNTQTNLLNVANYSTAFDVPSLICKGSNVTFNSRNSPQPDNSIWEIDGSPQYNYGNLTYNFNTAGTHTIALKNTFGTCPQSVTKQISVKDIPLPNGFNASITGSCGSPVAVNFKDNTPGAVKWEWDFSYDYYNIDIGSTKQAPIYTYTSDGQFLVWLRVTNADGCSNTTSQYIEITRPVVYITAGPGTLSSCTSLLTNTFSAGSSDPVVAAKWNFGDGGTSTDLNPTHTFKNTGKYTVTVNYTTKNGCTGTASYTQFSLSPPQPVTIYPAVPTVSCTTPITASFIVNTAENLAVTNWSFGDGSTSTDFSPSHTYTGIGQYTATLNYTTQSGCKGTTTYGPIVIDPKIKSDFSIKPNPVCGTNTATFTTTANVSDINSYNWDFGDGISTYGSSTAAHSYTAAGDYTVTLYERNVGGCDTTIKKTITVKQPFPRINGYTNTCDGTRGEVTFTQASVGATSVIWNFGDGSTVTTAGDQTTIKHTYTKTGIYYVKLTAINGQCSLVTTAPGPVYVLLKQKPSLTGSATATCNSSPVTIQLSKLDKNPYQSDDPYNYYYYYAGYYVQGVEYRDGTPFQGSRTDNGLRWTTSYNATLGNFKTGEKDIRFILTSAIFGCQDTSNYMPLAIKGASGGFEVVADKLCYQSPVILQDTSHSTPDNPILSWRWNFGDGQVETKTKGGTISHTYTDPGAYAVSLQITDAAGCSSSVPNIQYVNVNGPKAAFYPSGTDVHLNTTVYFYNNTNDWGNSNTVYNWDFGDGTTSSDAYPSHTYTVPGSYTVTMKATNPSLPCSSTATPVTIIVRNFNSAFGFTTSYITGSCPPVLARFNNTSYDYTRVTWDFGDGITADNVNYPSHVYEKPGKYIVTLYVYGYNGLKGQYIDSVFVKQPSAILKANPLESCLGHADTLSAKSANASSYVWDFGDGSIISTTDSFATHEYLTPGTYTTGLMINDAGGCSAAAGPNDKITVRPKPVISLSPAEPLICKGKSVSLNAGGGNSYLWSPAGGLSNTAISSPVASPDITTTYALRITDNFGCKNTGSVTVTVVQPVTVTVNADTGVCQGDPVYLHASGASLYSWINNTEGLSDTQIADPVATPAVTTRYTITGSDPYKCFTDIKEVNITVFPLPTVYAGEDVEVWAGETVQLNAAGSNDVIRWNWTPADYLDCSNCAAPLCLPLAQTLYTVNVKNQYGCGASDIILVKVRCEEAKVAIPNAFTPNGDGRNDVFMVKGISIIKHMVIYGRWGEKVFERNNFIAGDRSLCWNGTLNGQPAPTGTYVYFVEMQCPSGGLFTRKGTVVLIR